MKKGLFLFSVPFFVLSCTGNTITTSCKINLTSEHVQTSMTKVDKGTDLELALTIDPGYKVDSTCFTKLSIGGTSILANTNKWTYASSTLYISKTYVTGDIDIAITAKQNIQSYNVNVTSNEGITCQVQEDYCYNNKNYVLNFGVNDADKGAKCDVTINEVIFTGYTLTKNSSSNYNYTLTIPYQSINGDIDITLSASSEIYVSTESVSILNYDTYDVYYSDPLMGEVSYSSTSDAFTITKIDGGIRIDSNSNKVVENATITFSSTSFAANKTVNVTVKHPTDVEEALDSVTLGLLRGNYEFDITFNYNNSESKSVFASHLEIIENMYDDLCAIYSTGENKTNTFYLESGASVAHGLDYGTKEGVDTSECYESIPCANEKILAADLADDTSASTLKIDNLNRSLTVYNSEELFWAVEHGYIPMFVEGNANSQKAKQFYEFGREIVLNCTRDSMSEIEECLRIFNYFENMTTYDHDAAENSGSYPDWLKYKAYFMDGVFQNNDYRGYAVCDGFSKSYAFLCGLDCLPVFRSFGYTSSSGHAWNYVKYNDNWYLCCPTWAKNDDYLSIYSKNASYYNFYSFLQSKDYFKNYGGYEFSDDAFPLHTKSSSSVDSSVVYDLLDFSYNSKTYDFYVNSEEELTAILSKCKDLNLGKTEFFLTLYFEETNLSNIVSLVKKALNNSNLKANHINYTYYNNANNRFTLLFS